MGCTPVSPASKCETNWRSRSKGRWPGRAERERRRQAESHDSGRRKRKGIPGLGNVLVQAIQTGDQPVIMTSVFLGSILYLLALILTDIFYALADPRIRLS